MDPYDFPPCGYRCTVTIVRLILDTPWWFPSCNRCSRTCIPNGDGYKCNTCSCTGYRFKYKLCFIANDGTAESEMIAFGEVARRIVGKPVQQVFRASRFANDAPPDIAATVSLKFTFAITLTEHSYYTPQKTYQVTSVITSYGRQHALPNISCNQPKNPPASQTSQPTFQPHNYPPNVHPSLPDATFSPGVKTSASSSQSAVQKTVTQSMAIDNTPPPSLEHDESPLKRTTPLDATDPLIHPATRKRLFEDATSSKKDTEHQKNSHSETTTDPSDPLPHLASQRSTLQHMTPGTTKSSKSKTTHVPKNNQ
ncbi:uncharacterized protein LOC133904780 [Phragmites australis]|uniref:uncharacterized protein LOC133904780 n=1 Tax=Phragmites australis TaxID=29695 RepID=UPI002D78E341|nr:uncharacterized protein LOC133904780 [Phragmites australis]XP_062202307.1 uncharacterized protein LOC133904780 [Phragmites australis]XP_062202308.1 uncharacterized protein LOC133904780 [Phragmites australis]XP_062202310.1 uncharacterized protein LOC133904780 [Phragmites australis]